jgi:hypothetical protein
MERHKHSNRSSYPQEHHVSPAARHHRDDGRIEHTWDDREARDATEGMTGDHRRHHHGSRISTGIRNDYVQNWLAQTIADLHLHSSMNICEEVKRSSHCKSCSDIVPTEKHGELLTTLIPVSLKPKSKSPRQDSNVRAFLLEHGNHTNDGQEVTSSKRRKTAHKSPSESSFLEPGLILDCKTKSREGSEEFKRHDEPLRRPHKRQKVHQLSDDWLSSGCNSAIPHREEIFEKRKRHKTREDRYEPRKKHKVSHPGDRAETRQENKNGKKEKTKARRRSSKKAGEDLMHRFSSKKVGNERLTVRLSIS